MAIEDQIITLTLKADEICLSATCYSDRFDAKLIMEKVDMRKETIEKQTIILKPEEQYTPASCGEELGRD